MLGEMIPVPFVLNFYHCHKDDTENTPTNQEKREKNRKKFMSSYKQKNENDIENKVNLDIINEQEKIRKEKDLKKKKKKK